MMKDLEFWNEIEGIGELSIEMELLVGLEPVLFVCILEDNPREKYLVMTYNSAKTTYVMRKITDKELLNMLDKKITMEEVFRSGKEILKIYMREEEIYVERYNPLDFDGSMLPRKGATYNIRSQYILDYKNELRAPKFELSFQYDSYEIGIYESCANTVVEKNNTIFLNPLYQPILKEELSYCECKMRKIA